MTETCCYKNTLITNKVQTSVCDEILVCFHLYVTTKQKEKNRH